MDKDKANMFCQDITLHKSTSWCYCINLIPTRFTEDIMMNLTDKKKKTK